MKPQNIYMIGAKSLGNYGGYETFVYKLSEYHCNKKDLKYHIACKSNGQGSINEELLKNIIRINKDEFYYNNARCFKINVPQVGPAQAIYYDIAALIKCCQHIKDNNVDKPIVYIMACRIGPFASLFYKKIHKLGGKVLLNPDGHEWLRSKWSPMVRKYWKLSERIMVKFSDLVICDSINIENYIHETYNGRGIGGRDPKTKFIAYGADLMPSKLDDYDIKLLNWYKKFDIKKKEYYLIVGRFVPENSFEIMIREFMLCDSNRDLVIITNENSKYLNYLEKKLHFKNDSRIKFVGTIYDQELLKKIRENAFAYFHGHTVGGTNPSLIEALGSTDLNLLIDVGFNKEVAQDCALYWNANHKNLMKLINEVENMDEDKISEFGNKAKARVSKEYTWEKICKQYEEVFTNFEDY